LTDAEGLLAVGRLDFAIAEFQRFVHEHPRDWVGASRLADLVLNAGDAAAVDGRPADALSCLTAVANWRLARGDYSGAAELKARIDRLELDDLEAQIESARRHVTPVPQIMEEPVVSESAQVDRDELRVRASQARACVARGDAVAAAEFLTPEMAGGDPSVLLTIAEIQLRGDNLDCGLALVERVITQNALLAEAVAQLGIDLASRHPEAGFLLVEMATDVWITQSRWRQAKQAFEEFVSEAPQYVPAVARLHEIAASTNV
jgi:tetratricopeptide (TPR) repeat protein